MLRYDTILKPFQWANATRSPCEWWRVVQQILAAVQLLFRFGARGFKSKLACCAALRIAALRWDRPVYLLKFNTFNEDHSIKFLLPLRHGLYHADLVRPYTREQPWYVESQAEACGAVGG